MERPARVEDPQYYYRVDSLEGLRALDGAHFFAPVRWDVKGRWPHVPLEAALQHKSPTHGIYLVCFWISEAEGRKSFAERSMFGFERYILSRVPRGDVARALSGWTCEPDDFLPDTADMFWTVAPASSQEDRRYCGGIPFEHFEAWSDQHGWQPWSEAELLLPNRVRMSRAGWHQAVIPPLWPQAIIPRQIEATCHWQLADLPRGSGFERWCLVLPDRDHTVLGLMPVVRRFAASVLDSSGDD